MWLILASYWFSATLSEKSSWPRLCLFLVEKFRIILFLVLLTIKDSPCQAGLTDHYSQPEVASHHFEASSVSFFTIHSSIVSFGFELTIFPSMHCLLTISPQNSSHSHFWASVIIYLRLRLQVIVPSFPHVTFFLSWVCPPKVYPSTNSSYRFSQFFIQFPFLFFSQGILFFVWISTPFILDSNYIPP